MLSLSKRVSNGARALDRARKFRDRTMRLALLLTLLIATPGGAETLPVSKHIQKIMTKADGLTPKTAFKVSSVKDEYQIVVALGVTVQSQSLVLQKRAYDMLTVVSKSGETRELWFDISRFYSMY